MTRSRFELPSMSALLAFEATARLDSITLAAEERATSHSAISRHIRMLGDKQPHLRAHHRLHAGDVRAGAEPGVPYAQARTW